MGGSLNWEKTLSKKSPWVGGERRAIMGKEVGEAVFLKKKIELG